MSDVITTLDPHMFDLLKAGTQNLITELMDLRERLQRVEIERDAAIMSRDEANKALASRNDELIHAMGRNSHLESYLKAAQKTADQTANSMKMFHAEVESTLQAPSSRLLAQPSPVDSEKKAPEGDLETNIGLLAQTAKQS